MPPFQTYNCAGQSTSTDLLVEDGHGVSGSKALTSKKSLNGGCNLLADLGEHAELWVTADVKFGARSSTSRAAGSGRGCTAFQFAAEQWYCLEVQIENLPAAVEGDLHVDGAKQPFHIHQDEAQTVLNMDWTGARMLRPARALLRPAWKAPIYLDNLSVSTKRVGCGPKP